MEKMIAAAQGAMRQMGLEGWLLYDFRRCNDLACDFLQIDPAALLTRRFLYWIPVEGSPVLVRHAIEGHAFRHLPGDQILYSSWQQFDSALTNLLAAASGRKIAMEYSPKNALPYVSKVDAGTMEVVLSAGVAVESSAPLLQALCSGLTPQQLQSHHSAAHLLDRTIAATWDYIKKALDEKLPLDEWIIQKYVEALLEAGGATEHEVLCAVNANSADPHYIATKRGAAEIGAGDWVMVDLSCRLSGADAIWADITRVAVVGKAPTDRQQQIFSIVDAARGAAYALIQSRLAHGLPVMGWEVDACCRESISKAGFSQQFIHRTGHNLGKRLHGSGTHLDDFESHDCRELMPATCFTIEPGIYLAGEFGVRLEWSLSISPEGVLSLSDQGQKQIVTIFPP